MNNHTLLDKYKKLLDERSFVRHMGRVTKVVGLTIESEGPETHVGALCTIRSRGISTLWRRLWVSGTIASLMPIGDM